MDAGVSDLNASATVPGDGMVVGKVEVIYHLHPC